MVCGMNGTQTEIVTEKQTDSFGRVRGKIGSLRVWLTFAIDAGGTWLDDAGNYHFNAK